MHLYADANFQWGKISKIANNLERRQKTIDNQGIKKILVTQFVYIDNDFPWIRVDDALLRSIWILLMFPMNIAAAECECHLHHWARSWLCKSQSLAIYATYLRDLGINSSCSFAPVISVFSHTNSSSSSFRLRA